MPRWVAVLHLGLLATAPLTNGWAQEPVGVVPGREIASVIPQLHRVIAVKLEGVSVDAALQVVAKKAQLPITYNDAIVAGDRKVWLSAAEIRTDRALEAILQGSGLNLVALTSGQVVVVKEAGGRGKLPWQPGVVMVSGRVSIKETGLPIAGANVVLALADSSLRAVTTDSGTFAFANVSRGTHTVTVRYIGYYPLAKKVTVDSIPVHMDFALEARAVALEELVTTATGQQRRRDIGNSITTIHADSVMQAAPIRNLTDLLDNRVPGMTLQHTSGAPGDPARLRLRGLGSIRRSNDPVVVVDGVRIYAAQADARSGNLTNAINARTSNREINTDAPAPSPLDQIDPNIIEKIEVLKGPSAATLYGADAANGVIVITTKRGKTGPTRWAATIVRGRTTTAGSYPEGYYRWGQSLYHNVPVLCAVTNLTCQQDSLVRFQALNDPNLTVLGAGERTALSLTVSGGNQGLTYSVTGSYGDETGLLRLPAFEADRFRTSFSREPYDWMKRPHRLKNWSVSSNIGARLGESANLTLVSTISHSEQQRSNLEGQLARLTGTYVDQVNGIYYTPGNPISGQFNLQPNATIFSDYYSRTTASTLTFTTGLNGNWKPRSWLDLDAQAGLNVVPREDQVILPAGLVAVTDSGAIVQGAGRSLVSTFNLQGKLTRNLPWDFVFTTSVGANLTTQSTSDMTTAATGLVPGRSVIPGARQITATGSRASSSVYGWYIEPRVSGKTVSLSTGLRLDGGSAYGSRVAGGSLLSLPKLNGTWTISDEAFFPFKSLFSSLRLRGAYGQAQVQPSPIDRLRLYQYSVLGSSAVTLASLGNTQVRPERSKEFEGGFDADLMDGRVTVEFTGYRKDKTDALMQMRVPLSVNGGGTQITNVGNILNTGVELTLGLTPVRLPALTWNAQLFYSRNNNVLTKLGRGVTSDKSDGLAEGYPVGGRWARPILGYADQNGNGVLERSEIKLSDSLAFMGRLYPAYTAGLHTNVALFGGAIGISAGFAYDAGQTQINWTLADNWVHSAALFDPSASLGEQAAIVAATVDGGIGADGTTNYGFMQEVSTFRFKSLSVNYRAPERVARLLRARELTVAVQGSNLGMHSTYQGKDPDVNAWGPGESIGDRGQLSQPRTWQLSMRLNY